MNPGHLSLHIFRAKHIFRRYFVTNGFDGVFTMLGILTGFYATGMQDLSMALGACIGAAIALFMSGVSSAYLSEKAERTKELQDLENALLSDLRQSDYGLARKYLPVVVALVNGLSPMMFSLLIISPLFLAKAGYDLPLSPFLLSIFIGGICLFTLGVFLGRISHTFWLWSGLQTSLIALITVALILYFSFILTH